MNEAEFAELVRERPDLARHFHYVCSGKDGRSGYYRRIPSTYYDPKARSLGQLKLQIAVGKTARRAYGKKGFDEEGVPIVASETKKAVKGRRFKKDKWREIVKELEESLREIAEVVVRER